METARMEVFNELIRSEPQIKDLAVREVKPFIFLGPVALEAYRAKLKLMETAGVAADQIKATQQDAYDAGVALGEAKARLAELYEDAPDVPPGPKPGDRRPKDDELQTKKSVRAEFGEKVIRQGKAIKEHPEHWEAEQERAAKDADIPSAHNVYKKAAAARRNESLKKQDGEWDKERAAAPYEVANYISKMERALLALPPKPPADGWTDFTMERAVGYANVVVKRLGKFLDDELVLMAEKNIARLQIEEGMING